MHQSSSRHALKHQPGCEIQGRALNIETCFWTTLEQFRACTRFTVFYGSKFPPHIKRATNHLALPTKETNLCEALERACKTLYQFG